MIVGRTMDEEGGGGEFPPKENIGHCDTEDTIVAGN